MGRRGFYLARKVKQGQRVSLDDLSALKPWTELGPFDMARLRGKVYARDIAVGEALAPDDIAPDDSPSKD